MNVLLIKLTVSLNSPTQVCAEQSNLILRSAGRPEFPRAPLDDVTRTLEELGHVVVIPFP